MNAHTWSYTVILGLFIITAEAMSLQPATQQDAFIIGSDCYLLTASGSAASDTDAYWLLAGGNSQV